MTNIKELMLKKPWLIPFIASVLKGYTSPSLITKYLQCSGRLVKSALFFLKRYGLVEREVIENEVSKNKVCFIRKGKIFIVKIGATIIFSKVLKRRVKVYTLPYNVLDKVNNIENEKLRHRADVIRFVIKNYDEIVGYCEELLLFLGKEYSKKN